MRTSDPLAQYVPVLRDMALAWQAGGRFVGSSVPSLTVSSVGTIYAGASGVVLSAVGANTAWNNSTPWAVSAGSLASVEVLSATSARLYFNAPVGAGVVTVSDGTASAVITVAAVVPAVTDWDGLDLQLTMLGSSYLANPVGPGLPTVGQIIATASACPAGRFHLYAGNGAGTGDLSNQITAAIGAGHLGADVIAVIDPATMVNSALADPSQLADAVLCAGFLAAWIAEVERVIATGSQVLIGELQSVGLAHITDNGVTLRGQLAAWMSSHSTLMVERNQFPSFALTGTAGAYYIEQGNPAGPHFSQAGANLIAGIASLRISDLSDSAVTPPVSMSISPGTVVAGSVGNTLTVTALNTAWTAGTLFSVSSGTITNRSVTSPTSAVLTYTAGPAGIATFNTGGVTAQLSITEAVPGVLFSDEFAGSGALAAGWLSDNGAAAARVNGAMVRSDSGDFRTMYNLCGGNLPLGYRVRWTVPAIFVSAANAYRGLVGRWSEPGIAHGVWWRGTDRNSYRYCSGSFDDGTLQFTPVNAPPPSWALDQDHTIELRFRNVGGWERVELWLDEVQVGYRQIGAATLGTGIGTVGDGFNGVNVGYLSVLSVEVLPL